MEQASLGNRESRSHCCILKRGLRTCGSLDPDVAAAHVGPLWTRHQRSLLWAMVTTRKASEASPN